MSTQETKETWPVNVNAPARKHYWAVDPDEDRATHGRFAYNFATSRLEEYESPEVCLETRNYLRAYLAISGAQAAFLLQRIEAGEHVKPTWDSGREVGE